MSRMIRLVALATASLASQASAQTAPTSGEAPIVVTGTRQTPDEVRDRAADFVRRTGVVGLKPAARWIDPVCPRILGLSAEHSAIVERRLRQIGSDAGVRFATRRCEPNLAITFVADGAALVRDIAARSPRRLAEVDPEDRETMLSGPAPIRWFYTTQTRSDFGTKDGDPGMHTGGDGAEGGGSILPTRDGITSIASYRSSMISTQAQRGIIKATVVIDANRMDAMPLEGVADYAAMVGLAEIRTADPPPGESVLSMFQAGGQMGLTEWDAGLLRGLYRLRLDRGARRHRGALVNALIEPARPGKAGQPRSE